MWTTRVLRLGFATYIYNIDLYELVLALCNGDCAAPRRFHPYPRACIGPFSRAKGPILDHTGLDSLLDDDPLHDNHHLQVGLNASLTHVNDIVPSCSAISTAKDIADLQNQSTLR